MPKGWWERYGANAWTTVIVLNESSLRWILRSCFGYYQGSRTHLALGKDAPEPRAVQPPELGLVIEWSPTSVGFTTATNNGPLEE